MPRSTPVKTPGYQKGIRPPAGFSGIAAAFALTKGLAVVAANGWRLDLPVPVTRPSSSIHRRLRLTDAMDATLDFKLLQTPTE